MPARLGCCQQLQLERLAQLLLSDWQGYLPVPAQHQFQAQMEGRTLCPALPPVRMDPAEEHPQRLT